MNVKEETLKLQVLTTKALAWINTKAIKEERVTIQQLAQSLRVSVAKAKEIVGFLMRGPGDNDRLANTYQIFVQGNQIPDWMRPHLSGVAIAAILRTARNQNTTIVYRDVHRKILAEAYGDTFKGYLTSRYNHAANAIADALDRSGIDKKVFEAKVDDYPQLRQLNNPDWHVRSPMGGGSGLNITYTAVEGTEISLHFGSLRFETIEAAMYNVMPELVHSKHGRSDHMPEELDAKLDQVRKLISNMQDQGYGFVRMSRHFSMSKNRTHYTTIVFTMNDDLGLTVRVVLPWANVMFDEA
ncbi:hypothetical protein ST201phi2-1p260 [Pseudomonas phage 201phi2-1]|uniref:Uncharacterized protein n=1 Tax=Pseudomonas phage 201phi2-1 TaxID=198110 RepID=B3FJC2_BP201|nr:hypothetical protein ST201phi2-1p260 [Pseudomonas phage 201phi2-1]ABY63088.1 hypothetical protein 201phi2-1p260 [Pseudomonas phage 201phi2-1]